MKTVFIFLFCVLFFPILASGQRSPTELSSRIPKVQVHLDTAQAKPVHFPSAVMSLSPRCREGQCYAVFALDPQHGFQEGIVGFDLDGKSHIIDPAMIPGLSNTTVLDLAPIADGLALLAKADFKDPVPHKPRLQTGPVQPPTYSETNRRSQYFLILFKTDGSLQTINHLNPGFSPVRLAALGKDQYVMTGFNETSGMALLATMREDGEEIRILDNKNILPQGEALLKASNLKVEGEPSPEMKAGIQMGSLSALVFNYAADEAVLLNTNEERSTLWSIRGAEVENTRLQMPQGVQSAAVVSSGDNLIVRAFSSETDPGTLMEFNRITGALIREIDTSGVPGTSIFYEENGTVYAFWSRENQLFIVPGK